MKRMYGEERHFKVLRAEIESNDVDIAKERWHGYNEGTFKKYEKPSPTILRQTFSSSSTSTSTTTNLSTTTTTTTTSRITAPDNSTIEDVAYSTEDDDITSTENIYDTTVAEELPLSISTSSSSSTSTEQAKTSSPQIFQETTSEMPTLRLRGM